MNNITEHIKSRRSVRTFDGREMSKAAFEQNDPKLESEDEYISSYILV